MTSPARSLRGLALLALTAVPAAAQVTSVGPFEGNETTEFSSFPLNPIKGQMTPAGYVSTPHITGLVGLETAGSGGSTITPSSGTRMLGTIAHGCVMPSLIKWRLDELSDRVGFEIATTRNSTTNITVHLIDAQGGPIASVQETIPAGGSGWTWIGYESNVPIKRVHIARHSGTTPISMLVDRLVRGNDPGPSIGDAFGIAATNSTGAPAHLTVHGSVVLADGDLTLCAEGLPTGSLGVFLFADQPGRVALGDGTLLLGPSRFTRLSAQAIEYGTMTHEVDVASQPFAPGETWYFQTWFRDSTPGGSNLTQGVEVRFL